MAKKRMVAGYHLQQEGILAQGEPIRANVEVPQDADILCMRIDPHLNFVLFCQVWSHPEGTKVNFRKEEFAFCGPNMEIPHGSWEWMDTLSAGPQIYHVFRRPAEPRILQ